MTTSDRVMVTQRLRLRPVRAADGEALHACFGDPEAMRYWDASVSPHAAETTARLKQLTEIDARWAAGWAVTLKDSGAVIGYLAYHHREPWFRRTELGYILARPYWRQGLMTEAVRAFLDFCFRDLDTHRVEAMIEPDNVGSIRLVERFGFRREGRLEDRLLVAGRYRTVLVYALLEHRR
jgi:ribosomal-protein-alanine N-acetyltransferase